MSKKIAVSVETKNGLESFLDPRFGRAGAFIVVDVNSNEVLAEVENKLREAAHGAGTAAAALMAKIEVDAVVSGNFGPKASVALEELGIEMWTVLGRITVKEAVARYVSGRLKSESSSVETTNDNSLDLPGTDSKPGTGRGRGPCGAGNRNMGGRGKGRGGGRKSCGGGRGGQGQGAGRGQGQGSGRGGKGGSSR